MDSDEILVGRGRRIGKGGNGQILWALKKILRLLVESDGIRAVLGNLDIFSYLNRTHVVEVFRSMKFLLQW